MGLSDSEGSYVSHEEEFLDNTRISSEVSVEKKVENHLNFINEQSDLFIKEVSKKLHSVSNTYYKHNKDMSTLDKIAGVLIEKNICQLYKRVWDEFHRKDVEETYKKKDGVAINILTSMKVIMINYADKCKNISKAVYETNLIEYFLKDLTVPELSVDMLKKHKRRHLVKLMLGILHNCLRHFPENKHHVRKDNGLELLMKYYDSTFLIVKAKIIIVMAYCVTDEENDSILAGAGVIAFIAKLLKSALGEKNHVAKQYHFSALETVEAINKLASNDNNKKTLMEAGILSMLVAMLDRDNFSMNEIDAATNCIWTLSFHHENADIMKKDSELLEKISIIANSSQNLQTKKACQGIQFVLQSIETEPTIKIAHKDKGSEQIMLSYQWSFQPTILKIRDHLKSKGFKVWMDVDKMKGNILGAMAEAVENSSIIVLAMSDSYKNSNSCRTEAEYAYKLGKPITYLLLQPEYIPDGWLGALLGMNLYLDFTIPDNQSTVFSQLERDINEIFNPEVKKEITKARPQTSAIQPKKHSVANNIGQWSCEDTLKWFKSLNIGDCEFFNDCDGEMLVQLIKVKENAYQTYLSSLEQEIQLTFRQRLKFTAALEKIEQSELLEE